MKASYWIKVAPKGKTLLPGKNLIPGKKVFTG